MASVPIADLRGPRGTGVQFVVQTAPDKIEFELTDGTTTPEITLPAGPAGPNSVPTAEFMATVAADPESDFSAQVNAKMEAASVYIDASNPRFGSGRTHVEINAAIAYAASVGAGVFVPRKAGPWSVGRSVAGVQESGGIVCRNGVPLFSDGAEILLTDNTHIIKAGSTLGPRVTITADIAAASDTTITVSSSVSFSVGDNVFLRIGQAAYDAYEPDYWLFAKVAAKPSSTTLTLDRPVGATMSVSATSDVNQRSIAIITDLVNDVVIDGDWVLTNPMAGSANAESAVRLDHVPNARIGNIVANDPGAGAIYAQFVDQLTVGDLKIPRSRSQNGQASKGRGINFAEVGQAHIRSIDIADFDSNVIFAEARSALTVDLIASRNSSAARANSTAALFGAAGNTRITIGTVTTYGTSTVLTATYGTSGTSFRITNYYDRSLTRNVVPHLQDVEGDFSVDGRLFGRRQRFTRRIDLTASNYVEVPLPEGYFRRVRVYASTVTGLTELYLGCSLGNSGNLRSTLVAGGTVALEQGGGFGDGYNASKSPTGKKIIPITDATLPAGAYLIVDVDYYQTDVEPPLVG